MNRLKNKVIVITGAGMGLGYATALEAAAQGARLSLIDYNEKALDEAKVAIEKAQAGAEVLTVVADVSDESAVKKLRGQDHRKIRPDRRILQQCRDRRQAGPDDGIRYERV